MSQEQDTASEPATDVPDALALLERACASANGAARLGALAALPARTGQATSIVSYQSNGQALVIGAPDRALAAARALEAANAQIACTVLCAPDAAPAADAPSSAGIRTIYAAIASLRGYLGSFEVDIQHDGEVRALAPSLITAHQPYDLVLDMGEAPRIAADVPPPGYASVRDGDEAATAAAVAQLAELVGEFEKPRYFSYDPDVCAHGRSGQAGCTRCLDACPTEAIRSLGELVEIDPYLCQGGGSCATACPTGAIEYAYPAPADQSNRLAAVLSGYAQAGGEAPVVLFHDGEAGLEWVLEHMLALPEWVLPWQIEEIGSVGMDIWLGALAHGAHRVVLLSPPDLSARMAAEMQFQVGVTQTILRALGIDAAAISVVGAGAGIPGRLTEAAPGIGIAPARFAAVGDKRARIRLALDHLHAHAEIRPATCELPAGSPFGSVEVDGDACTLCMACVSVCPSSALIAGGDVPRLAFIEQNCVQCGLCERACPETAAARMPRLLFDPAARMARRTLNEDEPWPCPDCGKVFATHSIIERMRGKLAGHWMYQENPKALQRLELCEECRVKSMFRDGGGLLDPHIGRPPGSAEH